MKQNTNRVLFDYWNRLRGDQPAPHRFDIEPAHISQILSETLILQHHSSEGYRFRLAGTLVCAIFGRELRGEDFVALWNGDGDRVSLETSLAEISRNYRAARIEFAGHDIDGLDAAFEMLLLPLVQNGPTVDRYIGAISKLQSGEEIPVRPLRHARIVTTEFIVPANFTKDIQAAALKSRDRSSDKPAEIRPARIVRSRHRQFRVYDGGARNRQN